MIHAALNVLEGPLKGQSLPIAQRQCALGRGADCTIALDSYAKVSRRHALLSWDGRAFTIADQGSTNGVLVDGNRVQSAQLRSGSRLQLGDFAAELWLPPGRPRFADDRPNVLEKWWPPASLPKGLGGAWPQRRLLPVAIGVVAFCLAAIVIVRNHSRDPLRDILPPAATTAKRAPLPAPEAVKPIAPVDGRISPTSLQAAKDATVLISHPMGKADAFGSGFVAGDVRHVVTNRHVVVDGSGRATACLLVFSCGTAAETRIEVPAANIRLAPEREGNDFGSDLAVITLDKPIAPALPLGRSEDLTEGDEAYALGFPLGIETLTTGDALPSVSVKRESVERVQRGQIDGNAAATVIQLGGTVTHGNSGGPVVNNRGEVVGVISRKEQDADMAYAIPIGYLTGLLGGTGSG